jgi:glutathione S-transferase
VADCAVGITLPFAKTAHIPVAEFPEIERWHDRLNELPAWREPLPAMKAAA